jgi:hypothetical protein
MATISGDWRGPGRGSSFARHPYCRTAAETAYDPEGWDGRLWADVVDPRTGDYRRDGLSMLSDPMAESIIGMIHDGFRADDGFAINGFDLSDERLSGIMRELEVDRDRLTRI